MFNSSRVSIIIPVFNEEEIIDAVLSEVKAQPQVDEIIVVDDGSTDRTVEIVRSHDGVRVVQHPYNIGNGAAIKAGIRAATGDIIVMMDGDGQHPPAEIPNLLQHMDRYDMVVGARSIGTEAQWHRNLANRVFNTYASYIVGHPVVDLTSGFRAVRANIARAFMYLLPNTYSYPTTLTIALFRAGYAVKYHPFASPARVGRSKIRPMKDGVRFLLTSTRLATLFVPLKIFLPVSLLFLFSGGSYTIGKLVIEGQFSGFGGLVTSIGVFIFVLGLISEQIALLRYINSDR